MGKRKQVKDVDGDVGMDDAKVRVGDGNENESDEVCINQVLYFFLLNTNDFSL